MKILTLAGNPNVGKSTVFNYITGMKQHTGNWAGKTVANAKGYFKYNDESYTMFDIPGIYSLISQSKDEDIARDFICFQDVDKIIIVCDATSLERNFLLLLQTLEVRKNVVLCINLLDDAEKKGISIDIDKLKEILGIEVVYVSARKKIGIDTLFESIEKDIYNDSVYKFYYDEHIERAIGIVEEKLNFLDSDKIDKRWIALKFLEGNLELIEKIEMHFNMKQVQIQEIFDGVVEAELYLNTFEIDKKTLGESIVQTLYNNCTNIVEQVVSYRDKEYYKKDISIDKVLTSKKVGIPIMILLLGIIFWITIVGANYPSNFLSNLFFSFEDSLKNFLAYLHFPDLLISMLVDGVYKVVVWVVSVMFPPMAIFFPLFSILEDLGVLPRIAFNLDNIFKKCNACGKQALTMAMGFGCNACAITGCRIIDSPRERLIAIITNNFVPCNGRFPILISVISMFFIGGSIGFSKSILSAIILTGTIILGVFMTFLISKILSSTILKGMPSNFSLELPTYRKPQFLKNIVRSIFDRTVFVLARAIVVAIPAGFVIWIMANVFIGDTSLLLHITQFLDPFASLMGLDGVILMGFILGFPANEVVIPIVIMGYLGAGSLVDISDLNQLKELFLNNGWTINTAVSMILFTLFHWPCSTTCLTIKKETNSYKWTFISFMIPTVIGIIMCMAVTLLFKVFAYLI